MTYDLARLVPLILSQKRGECMYYTCGYHIFPTLDCYHRNLINISIKCQKLLYFFGLESKLTSFTGFLWSCNNKFFVSFFITFGYLYERGLLMQIGRGFMEMCHIRLFEDKIIVLVNSYATK